jgi:5-methylcytosine-specific restriction endonuclease McrA
MPRKVRDYKREYERYQGTPQQLKNQAKRHAARRAYEKAHGRLPDNVDVDHKKSIDKGGGNQLANLRAASRKKNRGFKRDAKSQPLK